MERIVGPGEIPAEDRDVTQAAIPLGAPPGHRPDRGVIGDVAGWDLVLPLRRVAVHRPGVETQLDRHVVRAVAVAETTRGDRAGGIDGLLPGGHGRRGRPPVEITTPLRVWRARGSLRGPLTRHIRVRVAPRIGCCRNGREREGGHRHDHARRQGPLPAHSAPLPSSARATFPKGHYRLLQDIHRSHSSQDIEHQFDHVSNSNCGVTNYTGVSPISTSFYCDFGVENVDWWWRVA